MGSAWKIPGFGWTNSNQKRTVEVTDYKIIESNEMIYDIPEELLEGTINLLEFQNQLRHNIDLYFMNNEQLRGDLEEFLATGISNGRSMKWSKMKISPNQRFSLHAHPNIEAIYIMKGKIYEYRYTETPPTKHFLTNPEKTVVFGPDLSQSVVPFELRIHSQNSFLFNEIGSIHLSYTQEEGAVLIVLWGGAHANVKKEQYPTNLQLSNP